MKVTFPTFDQATVIAEAADLIAGRHADEADLLLERMVHAGVRPSDLLRAAVDRGAAAELDRHRRSEALAAKQARLAAET